MSFVKPDGSIFQRTSETVLAIGQTAIILRHGPHALKVPKVRPLDSLKEDENRTIAIYNGGARRELANEQEVYRRLGQHNGIAQYIDISEDGTLLTFYKRGTLEDYIKNEKEVEPVRKADWMGSLTNTHLGFHDAKILVNDIFLRNILVADDLSLKMIDFGKCRLLPADTDMDQINNRGMTAQVEMHHLGSVFYSIATWRITSGTIVAKKRYCQQLKNFLMSETFFAAMLFGSAGQGAILPCNSFTMNYSRYHLPCQVWRLCLDSRGLRPTAVVQHDRLSLPEGR